MSGWAFTRAVLEHLSTEAEASPSDDLPEMMAALEKVKARVWQRLTTPAPTQAPPDRVLTVKEAAERLRTSPASLYRKWKRLKIGYIDPIDGRLKFSEAALAAHISRQNRAGRP